MAKITEGIALVVGVQSAEGTIDAEARDATIIANDDDGAGLSANEGHGLLIREESLSLDFERIEDEAQDRAGTFTAKPGGFIREKIPNFGFQVSAKGSGQTTTTPVAPEFDLPEAMEILLQGVGLAKGTSGASSTPYDLAAPAFLTIKVWRRDVSYAIQDCRVNSLRFNIEGGQISTVDVDIAPGAVVFSNSDTFPTSIDYGLLESTPPPALKGALATIGGVVRGQITGTVEIANNFEEFPDGNLPEGISFEMTKRRITYDGLFYVDSTDTDQDRVALLLETAPTIDIVFNLGTAAVAGGVANALKFDLRNVNLTKQNLAEPGSRRVIWDLGGYATDNGAADSEFQLSSI